MKQNLIALLTLLLLTTSIAAQESFPGVAADKTLVAWAAVADLDQRGGSVLTLDDGSSHFDGVVFGEIAPGRWMAGSDFYRRTLHEQDALAAETASPDAFVQIAVVYRETEVSVYRDGTLYSRHSISEPQTFGTESVVLIGPRHLEARDNNCFEGIVDYARIYDVALTEEQLLSLKPNEPSDPPPIAWWTFEEDQADDLMGAFPTARLLGDAEITSGKLVLKDSQSGMLTPPSAVLQTAPAIGPDVNEEWILNYHLMHPGAESLPGDPNAAFCLDGVYHLHYILTHPWQQGQSFSFVHVTSRDMLHWDWQTTKLQPSFTGHGMFSGTGFLTPDGLPAAIYHGQASGRNQIAIAQDRQLSAWEQPYPIDVRTADGAEANINHWDPDCFRIGDTYYAISGGPNPPLMKSNDLTHWTLVGDFMAHEMPDVTIGEDISCPNFFPIGNKWMLLCISHPLGCRYYIGDWDEQAEQFVPEQHARFNHRREEQLIWGLFRRTDFFAPESVLTPDGRRIMWAWLTSPGPDNRLLNKTIQSLPRELSLPDDGLLRIRPLRELETLRSDPITLSDVELSQPITGFGDVVPPTAAPHRQRLVELPGEAVEIRIVVPRVEAERKLFGVSLFAGENDIGLPIEFRPETQTLRVGTTEAPFVINDLPEGEDIVLRIFVDRYLVEVFVNDRQSLVAAYPDYVGKLWLDGFSVGAPTLLQTIELWTLSPTNEGFFRARTNRVWEPDRN